MGNIIRRAEGWGRILTSLCMNRGSCINDHGLTNSPRHQTDAKRCVFADFALEIGHHQ